MNFKYDEVLDLWVSEVDFLSQRVKLRLYSGDDADHQTLASKALRDVESNWEALRTAVVSELYQQYKDETNGELSADEFLSRLTLETIDYDSVDIMYTLFWSDAGMFGHHTIQVLWDPEKQFHADVSLVGGLVSQFVDECHQSSVKTGENREHRELCDHFLRSLCGLLFFNRGCHAPSYSSQGCWLDSTPSGSFSANLYSALQYLQRKTRTSPTTLSSTVH